MDEARAKLLREHGVLVLPEEIDHDAYALLVEALLLVDTLPHMKAITLYCAGLGGDTNAALAIADLLQHRGDVIGLLPGQADSCHADVWLACSERYVFPLGSMGIHETKYTFHNGTHVDVRFARNYAADVRSYNERSARLLAGACADDRFDTVYWLKVMEEIGSRGVRHYAAGWLIEMGIAKPIREYVKLPPVIPTPDPSPLQVYSAKVGDAPEARIYVQNPDGTLFRIDDKGLAVPVDEDSDGKT